MDGRFDTAASRQATRFDAIQGRFDPWLVGCFIALAALGLVMVASSSLAIAESRDLAPLYYFNRHAAFLCVGVLLAGIAMTRGDIRRIEQHSRLLPIIGILKRWDDRFPVYITPDFASAEAIAAAGADIIALDATARPRDGEPLDRLIARIRNELGKPVFADCATLEDGVRAAALGASYIATTLSGYTPETEARKALGPDIGLIEALAEAVPVPFVAVGRFEQPEQLEVAFRGTNAVFTGGAPNCVCDLINDFVCIIVIDGRKSFKQIRGVRVKAIAVLICNPVGK